MKQLKWLIVSIVFVCAQLNISCTSESDNPSPVQPEQTYSTATRELISLVDDNPQLKSLLEKAIAKGAEINPDRKTNPAQTLSEYYDFVEWAAHAMPWSVINQPEGTDFFTRIDQSLNYFFFINDIPLDELDGQSLYNNSLQYYELSEHGSSRLQRHGEPTLTARTRGIRTTMISWHKKILLEFRKDGTRMHQTGIHSTSSSLAS